MRKAQVMIVRGVVKLCFLVLARKEGVEKEKSSNSVPPKRYLAARCYWIGLIITDFVVEFWTISLRLHYGTHTISVRLLGILTLAAGRAA